MRRHISVALAFASILLLSGNELLAQNKVATSGNALQDFSNVDLKKIAQEDAYALPWATIWETNILWKKRVWRTIDTRAAENKVFSNAAEIPHDSRLANVLVQGAFNGNGIAYSAADDRFTKKLTRDELISIMSNNPGAATTGFNPEKVTKFLIKEDWLYLANEKKMVVRIVGIAPTREVTMPDGAITDQPLFWLYYPDIRNYLADHKVYSSSQNWDQLFQSRDFTSKIDKINDQSYRRAE